LRDPGGERKIRAMRHLRVFSAACIGLAAAAALSAAPAKPPKEPAKLEISVTPQAVGAGEEARVTVHIRPIEGIKVNRYPKIKLEIPARQGLVGEARAEVGNDTPPPPEQLSSNYFETVDPVELTLRLDSAAPKGTHEIDGKLTYYYCVAASGFCAPARVPVKIALAVR